MRPTTRFAVTCMVLGAALGSARADPPKAKATVVPHREVNPTLPGPDTSRLPAECRQWLTEPADSWGVALPWMMRLSLGACEEAHAATPRDYVTEAAQLPQLVAGLERAAAPSIAIYRDVLANAPATEIKLLAAYHLGSTYADLLVRARAAVPTESTATLAAADAHALEAQLEPLLAEDRAEAIRAFAAVTSFAAQAPAIAEADDVVRSAVRDARAALKAYGSEARR